MPLPVFLALALVGVVWLWRGRRRWGWGLLLAGLLCLFLAAWRPVADGLLGPLERSHPPLTDPAGLVGVSAVVVLGGGTWSEPGWPANLRLSEASAMRIVEGVRLVRALPGARLVVSGADRFGVRRPVALDYAEAARSLGVPAAQILVLDSPVDTGQEADAVRAVLGTGSRLVLVTSASHMRRAVLHFQRAGLDPVPAPTHFLVARSDGAHLRDWVPSAVNLRKTETVWHEWLGLLALRFEHPG
jgi:uncharacterized SAM-binding protein YcdF (DUF218 family)